MATYTRQNNTFMLINFLIIMLYKIRPLDDASIFFLASLPKKVYAVVKVFSLYSLSQLKGQSSKRGGLGQRMDLKWNNFKPLRGLEIEVVLEVLQEVAEKNMNLHEMASHCNKVKQLKVVQKSFIEATGMENWEEVTEKLPSFTGRVHICEKLHLHRQDRYN